MVLAILAGVHPSHYPYVRNGPACACTHRRASHVGTNKYGLPAEDLGCSECELCERYTPLEAVDHDAEAREHSKIIADQARRNKIHRRITSFQLLALILTIPLAVFSPGLFSWLIVIVVMVGLVNMDTAAYGEWRRGDITRLEALLQVGMSVGLLAFVVALTAGSSAAFWLIGLVLLLGCGFARLTQRRMARSMRSLNAIMADLKNQGYQP